jgi:hypothetical protein
MIWLEKRSKLNASGDSKGSLENWEEVNWKLGCRLGKLCFLQRDEVNDRKKGLMLEGLEDDRMFLE